jgi:hypothetical protein
MEICPVGSELDQQALLLDHSLVDGQHRCRSVSGIQFADLTIEHTSDTRTGL